MSILQVLLKMPGGTYRHEPLFRTTTFVGYVLSNPSSALRKKENIFYTDAIFIPLYSRNIRSKSRPTIVETKKNAVFYGLVVFKDTQYSVFNDRNIHSTQRSTFVAIVERSI